jgi:UDP-N-acetylmuramoyl-tripeptide--D-alanyl-D-alanine ligase
MSTGEIRAGIEAVKSIRMRMEMLNAGDGLVVLNDSYNANPVSVKAAIRFLAKEAADGGGRLIAILGDMLELGDYAVRGHQEVGAEAAEAGASYLFLLGNSVAHTARGAVDKGLSEKKIFTYPVGGHEKLIEDLKGVVRPKDRIVVKGSRGMKMETVVSGIMSWGTS